MKQIDLIAYDFKPNLRILKDYILSFGEDIVKLFDLKGNLLDKILFGNSDIVNIEIVKKNLIIVACSSFLQIMKVNNNLFEFYDIIEMPFTIKNIFIIKNKDLLLVSFINTMEIYVI